MGSVDAIFRFAAVRTSSRCGGDRAESLHLAAGRHSGRLIIRTGSTRARFLGMGLDKGFV
jgi:hypothetical protein